MDRRLNEVFLSTLLGNQVKNSEGEPLGRIEEFVIDPNDGRIKSIVVSLGEEPRFDLAVSAIPWKSLRLFDDRDSKGTSGEGIGGGSDGYAQSGSDKPSGQFSAYTYPVCRSR